MRRMNYNQKIYGPCLERPVNIYSVIIDPNDEDQWIQAMVFKTNEQNRNGDQIGDNSKQYGLICPLWWNRP